MLDAALLDLYSKRLKELGGTVKADQPLEGADATAKRRSPLCGSQITFDVTVEDDGRVREIGYKVRACALTEAAAGIVIEAAPGSSLDELRHIRSLVEQLLKGPDDEGPPLPQGKWSDLEVLRPARMVPSRHGSALLAFETVIEAVEKATEKKSRSKPAD